MITRGSSSALRRLPNSQLHSPNLTASTLNFHQLSLRSLFSEFCHRGRPTSGEQRTQEGLSAFDHTKHSIPQGSLCRSPLQLTAPGPRLSSCPPCHREIASPDRCLLSSSRSGRWSLSPTANGKWLALLKLSSAQMTSRANQCDSEVYITQLPTITALLCS